jgi:hypothetical protein
MAIQDRPIMIGINNKFVKFFLIIFLMIEILSYLSWGAFPAIGGLDKKAGSVPPQGSSGSRSISSYVEKAQQEERVFFIAYSLDDEEFFTSQNVTIQFLIINTLDSTVKFDSLTSVFPQRFVFEGCNPLENTKFENINNNIYIKTVGLSGIRASSYVYCNYTIKPMYPGNYVLRPAILRYSKGDITKNISSDVVYLRIKNRPPEIMEMSIEPNPIRNRLILGRLFGRNKAIFHITLKDADINDPIKCELWSNIDGLIYKSGFSRSNTSCINVSHRDFSIGLHTIKLKSIDTYGGMTEHEMMLTVMPNYFLQYLVISGLMTIIALCNIINTFKLTPEFTNKWCGWFCRNRYFKFWCKRTGRWYPWNIRIAILLISMILFEIIFS